MYHQYTMTCLTFCLSLFLSNFTKIYQYLVYESLLPFIIISPEKKFRRVIIDKLPLDILEVLNIFLHINIYSKAKW